MTVGELQSNTNVIGITEGKVGKEAQKVIE